MGASESKVQFRKGVHSLLNGKTDEGLPIDATFFESFVGLSVDAEDVFNSLSSSDVRLIRDTQRRAFAFVVESSVETLERGLKAETVDVQRVSSAVRVLTRLLPFVFEVESGESGEGGESVNWLWEGPSSLGLRLAQSTIQLLFLRQFTLTADAETNLWATGVAVSSDTSVSFSAATTKNRIDVLRLVQTLLSTQIFESPSNACKSHSRFAKVITRGLNQQLAQGLTVSLLNTALQYDPVGWGLLPYHHQLLGDPLQEQLVSLCLQTLVLLVDIGAVSKVPDLSKQDGTLEDVLLKLRLEKEKKEREEAEKEREKEERRAEKERKRLEKERRKAEKEGRVIEKEEEDDEASTIVAAETVTTEKKKKKKDKDGDESKEKKKKDKKEKKDKEEKKDKKKKEKELDVAVPVSPSVASVASVAPVVDEVEDEEEENQVVEEDAVVEEKVEEKVFIDKTAFGNNDFRYFISKISKKSDLDLIWTSIVRILKNPLEAANTYLPGSNKRVDLHIETIMLFWKFYEINEHFATLVKDSDLILPFTSTLLYFMIETKSSPNDIGLTRMSTFLLHILSQERTYAVHLNAPFDPTPYQAVTRHLPIFQGTWADFVTLALHHLITTTAKTPVATLHETMLMVLANMAPYFKCLCVVSCNKLMSLLKVFVNPAFLVSKEANHKCVFYLVDFCNGVVQYQVAGNSQLVYALVRNAELIHGLQDLTFDDAMQELARVRDSKAKRVAMEKLSGEKGEDEGDVSTLVAGRFVATEEWFNYWKSHLRLSTLITLVDALGPMISKYCIEKGFNDDKKAIEYLASGTTVGLLPLPQPIFTRKFTYTEAVRVWFTSYMWGNVYIKCANPSGGDAVVKACPSIWTGCDVQLFSVKIAE